MQAQQETLQLLQQVQSGQLRPEEALLQLKLAPFEDLGYAKIDSHRPIRQGAAEVIYGAGKTPEEILGILQRMTGDGGQNILVTRMAPEAAELVQTQLPLDYHPLSKVGIAAPTERPQVGNIVIVTGGTSDIPVAEEAALTAEGPVPETRPCPICGRPFLPDGRTRYCSAACSATALRKQKRDYMRKTRR